MLKRLLLCLALLTGIAAAQGGPYPSPSVTWTNVPIVSLINGGGVGSPALIPYIRPLPFPMNDGGGLLYINFTNVTGSPSGCQVIVYYTATIGIYANGVLTSAVTPVNTTVPIALRLSVAAGNNNFGSVSAVTIGWLCGTYPTSGSMTAEFVPDTQPPGFIYNHISANIGTVVKTAPSFLHAITINTPGSVETITVYDNTTCIAPVIAVIAPTATTQSTFIFDVVTNTGLCVATAGTTAGDYTVSFR